MKKQSRLLARCHCTHTLSGTACSFVISATSMSTFLSVLIASGSVQGTKVSLNSDSSTYCSAVSIITKARDHRHVDSVYVGSHGPGPSDEASAIAYLPSMNFTQGNDWLKKKKPFWIQVFATSDMELMSISQWVSGLLSEVPVSLYPLLKFLIHVHGSFNPQTLRNSLAAATVPVNSEVYLVQRANLTFHFWELYHLPGVGALFREVFQSSCGNESVFRCKDLAMRRGNFLGAQLRVLAKRNETVSRTLLFEPVVGNTNKSFRFSGGTVYHIFNDLMRSLNFSYTSVIVEDRLVPDPREEKNVRESMLMLANNEADLSITLYSLVTYRTKYLSYLLPLTKAEAFVFFQQPPVVGVRNALTLPFSRATWTGVLAFWGAAMGISLIFMRRYGTERDWTELNDLIMSLWGVMAFQDWTTRVISKYRLSIICLTASVTNFVLYSYYNAAFVAVVSKPPLLIQNYGDFHKYGYSVFTSNAAPPMVYDVTENDEDVQKMKAATKNVYVSTPDAVRKVLKPGSRYGFSYGLELFHEERRKLNVSDEDLCQLSAFKRRGNFGVRIAMSTPKLSPYLEFFRHRTVMILEKGLNTRQWKSHIRETVVGCSDFERPVKFLHLSMRDCISAFHSIGLGTVLAITGLMLEILIRKHEKNTAHP